VDRSVDTRALSHRLPLAVLGDVAASGNGSMFSIRRICGKGLEIMWDRLVSRCSKAEGVIPDAMFGRASGRWLS
jgi:hypothetical protein